jgi:hypothetical protein
VTFGDEVKLLGYDMPERQIKRGTPLPLALCWQSLATMDRDYTVFVHLFGREGKAVGQEDTYPGGGNYSTAQWEPGEVICDAYEVLVVPEAKAPSRAMVDIGVYDLDTGERLHAYDQDARPLERVLLAPFKIATWVPDRYDIHHSVEFEVGPDIALVGYRTEESTDTNLEVALYWQARSTPAEDYTVFVHLLDEAGELVAQHDGQPMGGDYPTSFWEEGETVKDEHDIELPRDLAPGQYQLQAGLYRAGDGQRLAVKNAGGEIIGDTVPLPEASLDVR